MHRRSFTALLVSTALAGCAATVKKGGSDASTPVRVPAESSSKLVLAVSGPATVTGSADWEGFRDEWREAFTEQARLAGIAFRMQPAGEARPTGEAGTLVQVRIKDYRFMRPGMRYGVGIYGGNAFIESRISFLDLKTGRSFGEQDYNTSSTAWQGIFSAVSNKQTQAIAADVVGQMKAR